MAKASVSQMPFAFRNYSSVSNCSGIYQDGGQENETTSSGFRGFGFRVQGWIHCLVGFPRAVRPKSTSPIPKKNQISKTRFWQNCSAAEVLCLAVLSPSLPCAIVSEMHVVKKTRGARNTAWNSDFVSCHHDIATETGKSPLRTLPFLQVSPLPKYYVLQCLLTPVTGQPE